MPIQVRSLESVNALHYRFIGRITTEDLQDLTTAEEPYFNALDEGECLSIIADLTGLETISPDLFSRLQQMRLFDDERVCSVVIVGANPYLRALVISLGVVTPRRRFTFRDNYDEGLRTLGLSGNGHHKAESAS